MTVRGAADVDAEEMEMERGESCTIDAVGQSWKEPESASLPERRDAIPWELGTGARFTTFILNKNA